MIRFPRRSGDSPPLVIIWWAEDVLIMRQAMMLLSSAAGLFMSRGRHPGAPVDLLFNAAPPRRCPLLFFVVGHRRAASISAGDNKAVKMINTTDLRDHKCNRPNVVGKDEDYCCRRCVNIL
jgi:hypothetical protein